jgi:hypothetical protein
LVVVHVVFDAWHSIIHARVGCGIIRVDCCSIGRRRSMHTRIV